MSSLRCWMTVPLLMLPASACNTVSRYLAGMDDPTYFIWEQSGDIATRNIPAPASTTTREMRQRIPGLLGEALALPPQAPAPVAPPAQSKGLAQDLKDCEAPTRQAPTPVSDVPGVPTIERSEKSGVFNDDAPCARAHPIANLRISHETQVHLAGACRCLLSFGCRT
jgi:hypothetical protein